MKDNYIVLGGNGFIGKNLCKYLLEKGKHVTSFDLFYPDVALDGITYIAGDFFDENFVKELLRNQNIIFHCISTINPGNSTNDYMRGYEKDVLHTVKMFDAIKGTDKKVIYLSSGGTVYGDVEKMPITEDTSTNPKNYYGNIKLAIENFIRTFNKINHTKHIIARISNPYGPGQDFNKGVGFIDAVIRKGLNNEAVEIWGVGDVIRDYIYIDDVCLMLYALAQYSGDEAVFNVSSNCGETQDQIIEIAKKYFSNLEVKYLPSRSIDAKRIVLCNSKVKQIITKDLVTIQEGFEMYVTYLKDHDDE